jgi:hypothetical protein
MPAGCTSYLSTVHSIGEHDVFFGEISLCRLPIKNYPKLCILDGTFGFFPPSLFYVARVAACSMVLCCVCSHGQPWGDNTAMHVRSPDLGNIYIPGGSYSSPLLRRIIMLCHCSVRKAHNKANSQRSSFEIVRENTLTSVPCPPGATRFGML